MHFIFFMKEEKQCKKQYLLGKGAMIAVLGIEIDEVKNLFKNHKIIDLVFVK